MDNQAPIGIFDSGVGGLTVVRAIHHTLPNESILYLGDTARVPYGTKSPEVVRRYALKCADFLCNQGAKAVIIACNTASAVAVEAIRERFQIPVLGVIEPGAAAAAHQSASGNIGVIGTQGTIDSGSYQAALSRLKPQSTIHAIPCPLFVPLAEEGLADHPATRLLAEEYLAPFSGKQIDTLVLGCTHYPLLQPLIQDVVGPHVKIINSAQAVAASALSMLEDAELNSKEKLTHHRFFSTDTATRFINVGNAFLGDRIHSVEVVDI